MAANPRSVDTSMSGGNGTRYSGFAHDYHFKDNGGGSGGGAEAFEPLLAHLSEAQFSTGVAEKAGSKFAKVVSAVAGKVI